MAATRVVGDAAPAEDGSPWAMRRFLALVRGPRHPGRMPKKKRRSDSPGRRPHKHSSTRPARNRSRERLERDRAVVLEEFSTWRSGGSPRSQVETDVGLLDMLLGLKSDQLDSPDPGEWTEELLVALLTDVAPRKVIQLRDQAMQYVPVLSAFFSYLQQTGRWSPGSMAPEAAAFVLSGLEFSVLEAAEDPTRRSFSTNIIGYGLEHGLDVEDEGAMTGFMAWYNELPHEERIQLSDTGRLEEPSVPYDPTSKGEPRPPSSSEADARATGDGESWPWFLPEGPEALSALTSADDASPPTSIDDERVDFVHRVVGILDVVGDGAPITTTGALNRDTTEQVLERLGLRQTFRSMWDVQEIVGAWNVLIDAGWLQVRGRRVVPGQGPVPVVAASEDPAGFVEFGHAAMTSLLLGLSARAPEDGGFVGMPDTAVALLLACRASGLMLRDPFEGDEVLEIPVDPRTGDEDIDELMRYVTVRSDLARLGTFGVLEFDGDHVQGSRALLLAFTMMTRIVDEDEGPA